MNYRFYKFNYVSGSMLFRIPNVKKILLTNKIFDLQHRNISTGRFYKNDLKSFHTRPTRYFCKQWFLLTFFSYKFHFLYSYILPICFDCFFFRKAFCFRHFHCEKSKKYCVKININRIVQNRPRELQLFFTKKIVFMWRNVSPVDLFGRHLMFKMLS